MPPGVLVAFVGHIFHPLQNQSVPENHPRCQLKLKCKVLKPVFSVDDDKEPKDLVNDGDDKKWEEDEPEDEVDSFIDDIYGEDAESVVVDNCSTGTKKLKGALGHLGEDGGEWAEVPLLPTTPLVHQEVRTIA